MPRHKLSNISLASLRKEIDRRLAGLDGLKTKRNKLANELENIDRQIAAIGGEAAPANGRRKKAAKQAVEKAGPKPKRATGKPLAEYVADVLKAEGGLAVKEIEDRVRKAGYPTTAKRSYNQVATMLAKGEFKRV